MFQIFQTSFLFLICNIINYYRIHSTPKVIPFSYYYLRMVTALTLLLGLSKWQERGSLGISLLSPCLTEFKAFRCLLYGIFISNVNLYITVSSSTFFSPLTNILLKFYCRWQRLKYYFPDYGVRLGPPESRNLI